MAQVNASKKILPTFYYFTHFNEFLSYIKKANQHLLSDKHRAFLSTYESLTSLQQCALVRLINRKHKVVKLASLRFSELGDFEPYLKEFLNNGLISRVTQHSYQNLIEVLTKAELIDLLKEASGNTQKISSSIKRTVLVTQCLNLSPDIVCTSKISRGYIVKNFVGFIDYFLFLYFGHIHGALNQFSMRDLGLMRASGEHAQMQSRFADINHSTNVYEYSKLKNRVCKSEFTREEDIRQCFESLPDVVCELSQLKKDEILLLLAKAMFAYNKVDALSMIQNCESDEAQEYWCRQAYKMNLKTELETRLHAIIENPNSDKILSFAESFLQQKYHQKRTSALTDMLRNSAQNLLIDEHYKGKVEQGVVSYYASRNLDARITENRIWRNLFGLTLWHELFELKGFGLATAFDYFPLCLTQKDINEKATPLVSKSIDAISTTQSLIKRLQLNATKYFGTKQGIVSWYPNLLNDLEVLIRGSDLRAIKAWLMHVFLDYKNRNDGFPDLMVIERDKLRFEEIKAQGDCLRINQLLQIQTLQKLGWQVEITTVDWNIDRKQPYVVVDIETTGGRHHNHRITEIAMVKIVENEVIDTWQSLVNPERNIPANIIGLTGIDNTMVANAPVFAELAEDIRKFSENCIFVAHNVNFDYGFIKQEFEFLSKKFRLPKLCTVQQMRKLYPGLKSYSLANLCKQFEIPMTQHHRAMSDALAASELLKLVNAKRLKLQKESI